MQSNTRQIRPAFAPEVEFEVQTLATLEGERLATLEETSFWEDLPAADRRQARRAPFCPLND